MFSLILGFITAFLITFSVIPVIIRVAREKRLYDKPNERSSHVEPTPSLGGVAIFSGMVCAMVLWTPLQEFGVLQYILAAFIIIFLLGVVDDLTPVSPATKFVGQLLVAVILSYKARIIISNLHGVMGVYELPEITSFMLSIVSIIGIINAFNLIDGINGLAASIGLLGTTILGVWFFLAGSPAFSLMALSMAGSIIAFLKFNLTPAKIFMGDTGSLLLGTVSAILAIKFIETNYSGGLQSDIFIPAAPAVAVAIYILPIFDTLRVFSTRLSKGKSPFHPDKTHIHHLMLGLGLSHVQATMYLMLFNVLFMALVMSVVSWGTAPVLALEFVIAGLFSWWLFRKAKDISED